MTDTTKPEWSEYDLMLQKLPYTLSTGITATLEGLAFGIMTPVEIAAAFSMWPYANVSTNVVLWTNVAERLLYRDGEPWCHAETWDDTILCGDTEGDFGPDLGSGGIALNIIAAIVVGGNPESLRVLHWCIHNLALD